MTTQNEKKLTKFLKNIKPDIVVLASWLKKLGISRDLQKHYRNNGWLESVGRGAYKTPGVKVQWKGGLYAMQYQSKLPVHVGSVTALYLNGSAHYMRQGKEKVYLFTPNKNKLPKWFMDYNWSDEIIHKRTNFLPVNIGMTIHKENNFDIKISSEPEFDVL